MTEPSSFGFAVMLFPFPDGSVNYEDVAARPAAQACAQRLAESSPSGSTPTADDDDIRL
jgi:hypothetical protein